VADPPGLIRSFDGAGSSARAGVSPGARAPI
jgi:hypothetical protein